MKQQHGEEDEEEPNWNDAKRMLEEVALNDQRDAATVTLQVGDLEHIHAEEREREGGEDVGEQTYDEDFEDEDATEQDDDDDDDLPAQDKEGADENSKLNSLEYSRTQRRGSESKEEVRGYFASNSYALSPRLEEGTTKIKCEYINDTTIGTSQVSVWLCNTCHSSRQSFVAATRIF